MMTEGWEKSSYSNGTGGNCVEARLMADQAAVRDTQNRELGHLAFESGEWAALMGALAK
ncbi:DUF397 domain-containing protein [Nocardiopsis sp. CC223A]|uniref:DUF397 domain-containing protein n=1 Tax=Nocardiopsis sp. CC223A TaxID=3044051 RepID=UPI00278C5683|nr:DUF397 domain-containing protein [Nocardiopsis sp. CC223A]